ncbi:hypothetical protein OF83DRAFT_1294786 [Amylostereum chailletii]|nr:hypothetical protein OF83DRAFT_1294786 [Amylostereum chailletii]
MSHPTLLRFTSSNAKAAPHRPPPPFAVDRTISHNTIYDPTTGVGHIPSINASTSPATQPPSPVITLTASWYPWPITVDGHRGYVTVVEAIHAIQRDFQRPVDEREMKRMEELGWASWLEDGFQRRAVATHAHNVHIRGDAIPYNHQVAGLWPAEEQNTPGQTVIIGCRPKV